MSITSHTISEHVDLGTCTQAFVSTGDAGQVLTIDDGCDLVRLTFAEARLLAAWVLAHIPDEQQDVKP